MDNENRPIGIFDSGVGGLSVLKKLAKEMPFEEYIYFGDTARVPYGEKTPEQLYSFVKDILDFFKSKNTKAVLMACNTSSAIVLEKIKNEYDFLILGLIEPTAKYIAGIEADNIGLMATSATVKSDAYAKAIHKLAPDKEVISVPCKGLVEIVEADMVHSNESKNLTKSYLKPLLDKNSQKLILGCTHYPFLIPVIDEITERPEMLIDPADFLVKEAYTQLAARNLLKTKGLGEIQYYVSSNPQGFLRTGRKFYPDCKLPELIDFSKAKGLCRNI